MSRKLVARAEIGLPPGLDSPGDEIARDLPGGDGPDSSGGVREPRRPPPSPLTGEAARPLPEPDETS